ncbi:inositol-tetrakisphosphate 1-kinase-like [Schistocerca gregaria]|uniref:inositol-tetrakisphosphate 1-kinase-like n=1 Tax=Schistocerca gregaria TaxID=7010 RepID=UPI00211E7B19|nr:inositol-tetrakisphosphate 1-kinase-like [Schistocerca gregaria]
MHMKTGGLKIGWYLGDRKAKKSHWIKFDAFVRSQGYSLCALSCNAEVEESDYDVILLKLTDQLSVENTNPEASALIRRMELIINSNPQAAVVDSIEAQRLTVNRRVMHELIKRLSNVEYIQCPLGFVLNSEEDLRSFSSDLSFPCMVKSGQASGSLMAHDMGIVWSAKDFGIFPYPIYVEEFINHDATLFKVYVLGDYISVVTRNSLPNFPRSGYHPPICFNSQEWKHTLPPEYMFEYTGKSPRPSDEVVRGLASEIKRLSNLTLLGFDVIVNAESKKMCVVDLNYFPDYMGVESLQERLLSHLIKACEMKRRELGGR